MNSRSYEAYVIPAFYIQLVKIKAKLVISTNYVIQKKEKVAFLIESIQLLILIWKSKTKCKRLKLSK